MLLLRQLLIIIVRMLGLTYNPRDTRDTTASRRSRVPGFAFIAFHESQRFSMHRGPQGDIQSTKRCSAMPISQSAYLITWDCHRRAHDTLPESRAPGDSLFSHISVSQRVITRPHGERSVQRDASALKEI